MGGLHISEQTSSLLDHPYYVQSQKLLVFYALYKINEYLQLNQCIGVVANADSLHDSVHPVQRPVIQFYQIVLVQSFQCC